ncbi:MAG: type IA DNA topoisomerase [Lachnospiraceae bacterium]|nr:type IA DNA topoisomerase [Lachnospiraceae bacterium]
MGKSIYIAEKPSVAKEFAKALKYNMKNKDGYMESDEAVVTWCVGHLVTMSYPEAYDEKYRRWSLDTIPFIPDEFKYEVIDGVKKQFQIVSGLLNREDVDTIYVCTDSGREGEYIYRLVEQQANVHGKARKRVWIDSQTEEEILRGIREAKDLSAYDNLSSAAYLRAKEDYLMGINFSRVLTLKYSNPIKSYLKADRAVVSVGRVMTCVLGMVVNREREIREFVKIPFYRVLLQVDIDGRECVCEWKAVEDSRYYRSPLLYKDNGFLQEKDADEFIHYLREDETVAPVVEKIEKKKETKNPPLLYNLAELQNDCSKLFKISPDETLRIAQELYEKKLTTYPRTDARVLSSAVAKEIHKNIGGLRGYPIAASYASEVLDSGSYKTIAKSRYVNDKQITDHYAIIPTGQGLNALNGLHPTSAKVYEIIVRRFLSIFYSAAVYQKINLGVTMKGEYFSTGFKVLAQEGYLPVTKYSFAKKKAEGDEGEEKADEQETTCDETFMETIQSLKKGKELRMTGVDKKEGETSPPKRYNSGTMILTMENAGQFIEDEELRAQIKGSGIGTSATRAEILKKLVNIKYLSLNKKTQIITPTLLGEMIYEVVAGSIKPLLDPRLTASWEKGLTLVADGEISEDEYMVKLDDFVTRRTNTVKQMNNQTALYNRFRYVAQFYQKHTQQNMKTVESR